MALKPYQVELTKDTLYEVVAMGGSEQLKPTLQAKGGTVTLYTSQDEPTSDPLTDDMIADATAVDGVKVLLAVPSYMLVSGTATSVISSGLRVTEVV